MEGLRLILTDGTIIENGSAGLAGVLMLFFPGYTMQEAAEIFLAPEKLTRIIFQASEDQKVYTGYTRCTSISIDDEGEITVMLKKEVI